DNIRGDAAELIDRIDSTSCAAAGRLTLAIQYSVLTGALVSHWRSDCSSQSRAGKKRVLTGTGNIFTSGGGALNLGAVTFADTGFPTRDRSSLTFSFSSFNFVSSSSNSSSNSPSLIRVLPISTATSERVMRLPPPSEFRLLPYCCPPSVH